MKRALCTAILLGAFATAKPAETNTASPPAASSRESRWKEDLDYFARELPAKQKDFFKLMPKKEFEKQVSDLQRELPRLSDGEIVLRLKRLAASLGVAHTRVGWPPRPLAFRTYPFALFWYSDGLGVFAAAPDYREAIGSRVVEVGSLIPQQVEVAVAPYISRENDAWLHNQSPGFMNISEVLQCLKIAEPDGRVRFSLIQPDGKPLRLEIAPTSAGTPTPLILPWDALPLSVPLCHQRPNVPYWYQFLPEAQTLYIHYRACTSAPSFTFGQFVKELLAFADSNFVGRVVVDLRNNGGGDSNVVKPLVKGLKSRRALTAKGHLYVLIGRGTFSSGLLAAIELRNEVRAILVGEPTGGKPNCYGNTPSFLLPNCRLEVWYCNRYFRTISNADPPSLEPDIAVTLSQNDFLAGRDPALEAALNHRLEGPIEDRRGRAP